MNENVKKKLLTVNNLKNKKSNLNDNNISEKIRCIDLFCGVGGLTHGLIRGGIQVIAGVDLDPQCRFAYENNNNNAIFIERDVKQLRANELVDMFGDSQLRLLYLTRS